MLQKYAKWNFLTPSKEQPTTEGLSPLVSAIVKARGAPIDFNITCDSADSLTSPALLQDIDLAAARLSAAIAAGERVAVYGDYDVDGITSTCMMATYLTERGLEPQVYIPERLDEGYGLSRSSIDALRDEGISLIVTVDCGISAVDEAAYAKSLGIDMIITDHHEGQNTLPDAVAVVDPKRAGDTYPYKELSGAGVAFKVICAVEGENSQGKMLDKYGDLLALGTVADMMPLTGENRTLVRRGMKQICNAPRPGISALLTECGIDRSEVNAQSISFAMAPRLNAAGRMGSAMLALELLMQDDDERARFLAKELGNLNKLRKKVEGKIFKQALAMLEQDGYSDGPIVLGHDCWHRGVVGIVAARLMRQYCRPVVLVSFEDGEGRGSCRSPEGLGFDVFSALAACSDTLAGYGGHRLAAGLTVDMDNFEAFKAQLLEYYRLNPPKFTQNELTIDFSVSEPDMLSVESIMSLEQLEPFGVGNPSPTLCLSGAKVRRIIPMGGGEHLKLIADKWGRELEGVYFSVSPEKLGVEAGDLIDIAFTPQVNRFRGKESAQMLITDVRQARPSQEEHECPERTHFICVYKYITGRGGRLTGERVQMLDDIKAAAGCGSVGIYYNCLAVMDELGLATVREERGRIDVELCRLSKKVDLESSVLLQGMRQSAGQAR